MPNYDIEVLDALVTIGMVDAAVLEAEAKHKAGQADINGGDLTA